jgi:hypothetical protein
MAEKRAFPRKRKRLIVDFELDGGKCSGFTVDISYTGLFIGTNQLPRLNQTLTVHLHLPEGKRVQCTGKVVRGRKMPAALAQTDANGFCLALAGYNEDYTRFFASLT